MPRISATLKPNIENIVKAYADYHDISFSQAIEHLTAIAGVQWWDKLNRVQKREYQEKYGIVIKKYLTTNTIKQ